MTYFSENELNSADTKQRRNLLNLISGVRTPFLIGTYDQSGVSNLGLFNSITHIGANPPLIGFIQRPLTVERQTYTNLKNTGVYTLNAVSQAFVEKAHQASAKYEKGISEFEKCGLKSTDINGFNAPFVEESPLRLGMKLREDIRIESNGCRMIIGQVIHLMINASLDDEGLGFRADEIGLMGVGGLDRYYTINFSSKEPFARP